MFHDHEIKARPAGMVDCFGLVPYRRTGAQVQVWQSQDVGFNE